MSILDALNPYALVFKLATFVALLATATGFGAYEMHKHDTVKYDALQKQFSVFKATTEALGEQAKKEAAAQALHDLENKERADAENKRTHAADIDTIVRLRKQLDATRGSFVPAPPAGTSRPDLACFDRATFESALRDFVVEIRGQVDEGTAATIDLNTTKVWAQSK